MKIKCLVFALSVGFVLAGCAPLHNIPSMPVSLDTAPTTPQDMADASNHALWGVYVDLADTSRISTHGGTRITWHWLRPGRVMHQIRKLRGSPEPIVDVLWRDEQPGVIYAQTLGVMGTAWRGQTKPDGSVLFIGAGPFASSYRAAMTQNGTLELRSATIKDGVLISLGDPLPANRYVKDSSPLGGVANETTASPTRAAAIPSGIAEAILGGGAPESRRASSDAVASYPDFGAALLAGLAELRAGAGSSQKEVNKIDDFWSYCWHYLNTSEGEVKVMFISNLINQRIWNEPYPLNSEKGRAEFAAYDGPNKSYLVLQRFENAVRTSGSLPSHNPKATSTGCNTFDDRQLASSYHDRHKTVPGVHIRSVNWKSLEHERLTFPMVRLTPQEEERLNRGTGLVK